jgi:hypothetical protein
VLVTVAVEVPIVVAVTVIAAVTVVDAVTNFQLCHFCGPLSFSNDAPILCEFYGATQLFTLTRF